KTNPNFSNEEIFTNYSSKILDTFKRKNNIDLSFANYFYCQLGEIENEDEKTQLLSALDALLFPNSKPEKLDEERKKKLNTDYFPALLDFFGKNYGFLGSPQKMIRLLGLINAYFDGPFQKEFSNNSAIVESNRQWFQTL